jgi:hypothetical protein
MDEQLRAALQGNFKNFLYYIWKHLKLPNPTPIQYDIADYLVDCPPRTAIQAYRGAGKSWICSVYCIWRLWNDPQLKILIVSASKERADAFAIFTKRLINEVDILEDMRSRPGQRDSTTLFDVGLSDAAHAPSLKSIGITSQLAGNRADLLISDDVESLKNSLTAVMRERLGEYIKEYDAIITPKPTSKIIYLGTPQSEESIYNKLGERGYTTRIWPARMPRDCSEYGGALAPYIENLGVPAGTPIDPLRFDEQDLQNREASFGRSGFNLQFMLNPILSDADKRPLKLADLIIMDCNPTVAPIKLAWGRGTANLLQDVPNVGLHQDRLYAPMFQSNEWAEYTGCVMAIDPAGGGTTSKDDTGYAVVKILHGMLYLVAAGGIPGGYANDVLEKLAEIAKQHQAQTIVIESNLGLGMFGSLLKPVLLRMGYPVTIEEIRHHIQKERRIIDTLEPVMNQHRLVVDKQLVIDDYRQDRDVTYKLFYQMTRLTRDRGALAHDDAIDVLSMAVAYWVDYMARDNSAAADEYLDDLRDAEYERFADHVLGREPAGHSFIEKW